MGPEQIEDMPTCQGEVLPQFNLAVINNSNKDSSAAINNNRIMEKPPATDAAAKQWAAVLPNLVKPSPIIDLETRQFSIPVVSLSIEDQERSQAVATALLSHSASDDDSLDNGLSGIGDAIMELSEEEEQTYQGEVQIYKDIFGESLTGRKNFGRKQLNDLISHLLKVIDEEEKKGTDSETSRRRILYHAETLYILMNHTLRQTESEAARELLKELAKFVKKVVDTYQDLPSRIMAYVIGGLKILGGVGALLGPLASGIEAIAGFHSHISKLPTLQSITNAMKNASWVKDIGNFGAEATGAFKGVQDEGVRGVRTTHEADVERIKGFRQECQKKEDNFKNSEERSKQNMDRMIQHLGEIFNLIMRS